MSNMDEVQIRAIAKEITNTNPTTVKEEPASNPFEQSMGGNSVVFDQSLVARNFNNTIGAKNQTSNLEQKQEGRSESTNLEESTYNYMADQDNVKAQNRDSKRITRNKTGESLARLDAETAKEKNCCIIF